MKKFIKWFLLLLWLSFIFYMSNQTGSTSGGMSDKIYYFLAKLLPFLENNKDLCLLFIRKGAHVFEYFILGILVVNIIKEYTINHKNIVIISLLLCSIFASVDETHQLFIDGRAGKITDVMIDSIGYISAVILLNLKK